MGRIIDAYFFYGFIWFLGEVIYLVIALLQMWKYDGTGAEALKTTVDDLFTNQIQIQDYNSKVISTTTDGASVNTS